MKKSSEVEVKISFSVADLVAALQQLSAEDREFFIENLLAATSPEYLKSIDEARTEYREGKIISYEKLFKG